MGQILPTDLEKLGFDLRTRVNGHIARPCGFAQPSQHDSDARRCIDTVVPSYLQRQVGNAIRHQAVQAI